jgi:transcriptional regulator with XRE-family HTH domain
MRRAEDRQRLAISIEIELGERLHKLRSERRLSLRDLADQSGLTASFISQVERGRASPSIASLARLAKVLEVSVGHFFDPTPQAGRFVGRNQRRTIVLRGLGEVDEYITADPAGRLQVAISTFEVDGRSAEAPFVHESEEECVLVLEGRLEVAVGEDSYVLEAGDAVTYSPQTPHIARNIGPGPAKVVFVMTPPSF